MGTVKGGVPRTSRKEKAQATRRRIVECARVAFLERGYTDTTVDSVARAAGVAVQTVYFTFRTKGDLLQAVYEQVVLGPDGLHPHETAWWQQVEQADDVVAAVHALVGGTVELLERAAPLVWMVLGDPTARSAHDYNEALRRAGNQQLVRMLSDKHPLRADLTPDRARDVLLVLTGPPLYSQFTRDLGWLRDDVAAWMATTILRDLFGLDPV